jgi:hypothetical protein
LSSLVKDSFINREQSRYRKSINGNDQVSKPLEESKSLYASAITSGQEIVIAAVPSAAVSLLEA